MILGIQIRTTVSFPSICWNDKWKKNCSNGRKNMRGNKGLHDHKVNYLSISCKRRRPGTVGHANHSHTPKRAVVWQVYGHASENFATLTSLIWWLSTRRWWKEHIWVFRYFHHRLTSLNGSQRMRKPNSPWFIRGREGGREGGESGQEKTWL